MDRKELWHNVFLEAMRMELMAAPYASIDVEEVTEFCARLADASIVAADKRGMCEVSFS